jgi:hypothetical protein
VSFAVIALCDRVVEAQNPKIITLYRTQSSTRKAIESISYWASDEIKKSCKITMFTAPEP